MLASYNYFSRVAFNEQSSFIYIEYTMGLNITFGIFKRLKVTYFLSVPFTCVFCYALHLFKKKLKL